jgi:hypothetical protein
MMIEEEWEGRKEGRKEEGGVKRKQPSVQQ